MTAMHTLETNAIERLIQAIEALDAAGYSCWFLETVSVDNMIISLEGIPTELPLLPCEIGMIASAYDEIMALADWCDSRSVVGPKRSL